MYGISPIFLQIMRPGRQQELRPSIESNELESSKGTLGDSAKSLLTASDQISRVYKDVARLYVYANLMADADTRNAENEERSQMARNLLTNLSTAVSWYNLELLSLGDKKINAFIAQEPGLEKHRFGMANSHDRPSYPQWRY